LFELRPYQKETIEKVLISMKRGNRCIIVQQPPSYWENRNIF